MRTPNPALLLLPLATACGSLDLDLPAERDCDTRLPFYQDADGDGFGADSPVYLGCEAPSGWVEQGGDCDDDDPAVIDCPDTAPPDDTGEEPADTGTEPADTGDTTEQPSDTDSPQRG